MTRPTLRELASLPTEPAALTDSTLVLIDCQNTYTEGVMALDGVAAALDEIAALLDRARTAGIPIVHVQHDDGPGSLYDVNGHSGAIVAAVAPRDGERVVVKNYPNSFVNTEFDQRLKAVGATNPVLTGFMTHMCVNSPAGPSTWVTRRPSSRVPPPPARCPASTGRPCPPTRCSRPAWPR